MNLFAHSIGSRRIADPIDRAAHSAIGLTCGLALHASIWPQYSDRDFAIFLTVLAAFVSFSVGYAFWFRCIRNRRDRPPPDGHTPPAVDALSPVPLTPRTPVRERGEMKTMPVEEVAPMRTAVLEYEIAGSDQPVDPISPEKTR